MKKEQKRFILLFRHSVTTTNKIGMKAKLICHFHDIKEQRGDIVTVTSATDDHVYIVGTRKDDGSKVVIAAWHDDVEIVPDEGHEPSLKVMIVMMSVSAVVGLLLFVISELIQLSSFIGFVLCMSGYIATFTVLRSCMRP